MIIIIGNRFVHFGNMADTTLGYFFNAKYRQRPIRILRKAANSHDPGSLHQRKSVASDSRLRKGRK
jgi:hypothetical protein